MNLPTPSTNPHPDDHFELSRFVEAQEDTHQAALTEIRQGRKRSHWMWFIYPQLRGLGQSAMAQRYGIGGADEAQAYLSHPILGPRLIAMCEAALSVEGRSATEIFGTPDDLKLRSSATLFAQVSEPGSVFHQILEKYYDGQPDQRTLQLLDPN